MVLVLELFALTHGETGLQASSNSVGFGLRTASGRQAGCLVATICSYAVFEMLVGAECS